jgi:LPXTG-motif cell wall-anchored protein
VSTLDGFTFDITNYDPNTVYTLGASNGANAEADINGHVTVTGLAAGESSTVTVMASLSGSLSSFGSVTGSALATGVAPALSAPVSTADGFTFDITNYDPNTLYTFDVTGGGTASVDGSGHVTVSGLAAGDSSTVTVTATVDGSTDASDSVTGQALPAPVVTPTPTPSTTPTPAPSETPTPAVTPSPSASSSTILPNLLGGSLTNPDGVLPAGSPSTGPSAHDGNGAANTAPTVADAVKPGKGAVTLNGVAVGSTLSQTHSRLVLTSGGLVLELAAIVNGHEVMLPAGSVFTTVQGGHLHVWLKGFKAGTPAFVWGFSTPVQLAKLAIGADNKGDAEFTLPSSMKPGNHMLVVSGIAANGKRATMTVGLVITAAAAAPASSVVHPAPAKGHGSDWTWLWLVLGGLALLGLILFLIWRRRHEDEEEAPAATKPALPSTGVMPQQRTPDESKPGLPKHRGMLQPRQPEADRDRDRQA